ncbi:MAG: phosphoribosylformylglycinamidine cyclo-ligase [Nitrososphaerales archaeon]
MSLSNQLKGGSPRPHLSYASAGVDREKRVRSRRSVFAVVSKLMGSYGLGEPLSLPFGTIFPAGYESKTYFDFQIEGVGTKTLLAELAGQFDTIGIDAVAMAVNDTIRSGAKPILVSDALHIGETRSLQIETILRGVAEAAEEAGCIIASGETGNVAEILHMPLNQTSMPFDLFVSALGIVDKKDIISGRVSQGDAIIGIESSGIHSNGLSLARKLLIKKWGGAFDAFSRPEGLDSSLIEELMKPTRIYVKPLSAFLKCSKVKAAIHITGDGFSKFNRLLEFQKGAGFVFDSLGPLPPIFDLIQRCAKKMKTPISSQEMFRTFNMGYGFGVVVSKKDEDAAIDSFNRYFPAKRIGRVTDNGNVVLSISKRKIVL